MIPSNYDVQFMVAVRSKTIDVYTKDAKANDDEDEEEEPGMYTVLVKSYANKNVFLGYEKKKAKKKHLRFDYNSVLIEIGPCKYVHVGNVSMFEFKTDSPVLEYVSPMGNNLVTYAYAVTRERVYMMTFETYLPVDVIREKNWSLKEGEPFKVKMISHCLSCGRR